jgi:hypothetical protein
MESLRGGAFPGVTRRERQMALDIAMKLGLPPILGTWYFVDPENGAAANKGRVPWQAVQSIETAYGLCTTGDGDGICIYSSGTTTANTTTRISTAITWSKHGITVVGVCSGNRMFQRARISNTTTVLTLPALITVSGSNNRFQNLSFFNSGTDAAALGCVIVTGARNAFDNCHFVGGSCTTATANERSLELGTGSQENYFHKCTFGSCTIDRGNNANCELYVNSSSADGRNFFENCQFTSMSTTAGGAHLAVKSAGATSLGRHIFFKDCIFDCFIPNKGAATAFAFGGTMPASGYFVIANTATLVGYAAWETGSTGVMVSMAAGSATGGLVAGG